MLTALLYALIQSEEEQKAGGSADAGGGTADTMTFDDVVDPSGKPRCFSLQVAAYFKLTPDLRFSYQLAWPCPLGHDAMWRNSAFKEMR